MPPQLMHEMKGKPTGKPKYDVSQAGNDLTYVRVDLESADGPSLTINFESVLRPAQDD